MLHDADSFAVNDCRSTAEAATPEVTKKRREIHLQIARQANPAEPVASRYGERRGFNIWAFTLTVLVHLLVIGVLLGVRHHVTRHEAERLITVNLSPPPPPPPASTPDQPKPKQPAIAAPRPMVQIDLPKQMNVPAVVDPQPAPPSAEPAREANASSGTVSAPASVIQGGELGARMVAGKPPRYPTESRRKREQGTVILSLVLGVDGAVEQISVSSSSGFDRLDRAALEAVRKWRWEPVTRGGQAVKVKGTVEIPFVLQG